MSKCKDDFRSIKKGNDNISTRNEFAIPNTQYNIQQSDLPSNALEATYGGEMHLHSNTIINIPTVNNTINERVELNGTNAIAIPACNPTDIMPRLIKAYKTRAKYGILLMSLVTIGMIIASSICFVLAKQNEAKGLNKIKPLIYGIITAITSAILLICVCILCHGLRNGFNWMNRVLRTIELDGKIWQYQVDSLQITVPRSILGFCVGNIHGRLRTRPKGYIIMTEEGLIVDEFMALRYEVMIVLQVDLINNTMQTGWILRVFFCTRDKSDSGSNKGRRTMFQVDLFMPLYMQVDEVNDIRQVILSNSQKYLLASKLNVNRQVNSQ